ncbi:MAG TPA: SDR family NAD(P)-dependent oxidoreductase [Candidatus Avisuccinivibrio pullicola]|nr:SDR family NAD(P)-dependent oxidoreductase [Candidatus Avisuccinivibrio pullicola]
MSKSVLTAIRTLNLGDCPIAVVGMGCRFPKGIVSAEGLYQALLGGENLVSEVPEARFGLKRFLHPKREVKGHSVTFKAGVVGDVSLFDAPFFNLSRPEALSLDPQQRLTLEMSYEALNRAGLKPQDLKGSDTAVVMGAASTDMALLRADDTPAVGPYAMTGTNLSIISNRLSYVYDLHGPSLTVDTACSSSLVALHTACEYLREGKASMALAGGVNILLSPLPFIGFSQAHMLSDKGRCAVFCENADGYVRAEGGAVLILKRLEDALADGNNIMAVIAATGVNSDGATRGIALPSEKAQQSLLTRVYGEAGLDPARLVYVEAHGTGTKVGDPVEMEAIGRALGQRVTGRSLSVGSVKANTGHLETASGMAGFAKAMEILRTGVIPPQKLYGPLNTAIPFEKLNLRVATEAEPLPMVDGVGLIGVNSFGFGGTNAHVVLADVKALRAALTGITPAVSSESAVNGATAPALASHKEGPKDEPEPQAKSQEELIKEPQEAADLHAIRNSTESIESNTSLRMQLSARTLTSLKALALALSESITDENQEAVCEALSLRERMRLGLSVSARDASGLKEGLKAFANDTLGTGERWPRLNATYYPLKESAVVVSEEVPTGPMALVFTGNGAQYAGMGKELYASNATFRNAVDEVSELLVSLGAPAVADLFVTLPEAELFRQGDPVTLTDPAAELLASPLGSQLALFAMEVGLTRILEESGLKPCAVLGHSVGEVAAAWAAGRLSLKEAVLVIYTRSRYQALTSTEGGMAAVKLEEGALRELLKSGAYPTVEVAGFNAPHNYTLSGLKRELKDLQGKVKARGGVMRLLSLNYAFHSAFMEQVREPVLKELSALGREKSAPDVPSSPEGRELQDKYENAENALAAGTLPFKGERYAFISTVTGKVEEITDAHYWWRNIRKPVRFESAVREALERGVTTFVEVGPKGILTTYVHECARAMGKNVTALSLTTEKKAKDSDVAAVLELIHVLAVSGTGSDVSLTSLSEAARELLPSLPTYAFDKVPCWLDSSPECQGIFKGAADPLLGVRTPAGTHEHYVSTLDGTVVPALSHHEVRGECLFPFTGFLNNALRLALAEKGKHNAVSLLNFEVRHALSLSSLTRLESALDEHGEVSMLARPYGAEGRGDLCVRARVLPVDVKAACLDLPALEARFTEEVDVEDFYARLKDCGFNYGPFFRSIRKIALPEEQHPGAVLVTARYVKDVEGALLSLGGMDACLQALFALLLPRRKDEGELLYLPVSVGRLTLYRVPEEGTVKVLLENLRKGSAVLTFEMTLLSATGEVLLKGSEVRFKALPQGARPAFFSETTALLYSKEELRALGARLTQAPVSQSHSASASVSDSVSDFAAVAGEAPVAESPAVGAAAAVTATVTDTAAAAYVAPQSGDAGTEAVPRVSLSQSAVDPKVRALRQAALCAFILEGVDPALSVGEELSPEEIFGSLLYGADLDVARHALNLLCRAGMAESVADDLYTLKDISVLGLDSAALFDELLERDRLHGALYLPFKGESFKLAREEGAESPVTARKALTTAESLIRAILRCAEGAQVLTRLTRKLKESLSRNRDGEERVRVRRLCLLGDPTLCTLADLVPYLKEGTLELTLPVPSEEGALEVLKERLTLLHLDGVRLINVRELEKEALATQSGERAGGNVSRGLRPVYDALVVGPLTLPSERVALSALLTALKEDACVFHLSLSDAPLVTLNYALSLRGGEALPDFCLPGALFASPEVTAAALRSKLKGQGELTGKTGDLFALYSYSRPALPAALRGARESGSGSLTLSHVGVRFTLSSYLTDGALPLQESAVDAADLALDSRLEAALTAVRSEVSRERPLIVDARLYGVRETSRLSALLYLASRVCALSTALPSLIWLLPYSEEGEPLGAALRAALRTAARELSLPWLTLVECASPERVPESQLAAALLSEIMPTPREGKSAEYVLHNAGLSVRNVQSLQGERAECLRDPGQGERRADAVEASEADVTSSRNASLQETVKTGDQVREHYYLDTLRRGRLNSLTFVKGELPVPDATDPADLRVQISVRAAGLNFRDVMWASGLLPSEALERGFSGTGLGLECAGEVVAVGGGALRRGLTVGMRVMALAPHALATSVVTKAHAVFPLPEGLSFAEGAALPVVFFTAAYSLIEKARARKGESVLIHGAAGGVGLAALQIALGLGLTVHATAGSEHRRALLKSLGAHYVYDSRSLHFVEEVLGNTQGKGVSIVLNSLYDRAGAWSFELTARGGTFIELGKRDFYEDHPLYLKHFKDNVTYCGVDADALVADFPEVASAVMDKVAEGFKTGLYRPLPVSLYTASCVEEAFLDMRHSRHVGKVVILPPGFEEGAYEREPEYRGSTKLSAAAPSSASRKSAAASGFSLERTLSVKDMLFIVTGGTGGVGKALVTELVARGAQHVHVLARHLPKSVAGRPSSATQDKLTVHYHAVDVADAQAVEKCVKAITESLKAPSATVDPSTETYSDLSLPPVTLLHVAGLTRDKAFREVSVSDIQTVLEVKYLGALNLIQALKGKARLCSFLALSSVTVLLGNPGQLAYVAANAALESLAGRLRKAGVAATVLGLGPVAGAGMLHGKERLLDAFARQLGAKALSVPEVILAIGRLGSQSPAVSYYFATDLRKLSPLMGENRRFAGLSLGFTRAGMGEEGSLSARLSALPREEAQALLTSVLRAELASLMGVEPASVEVTRPLTALGVDSLLVMEFITALEEKLACKIPLSVASDELSLESLAQSLLKLIRKEENLAGEEGVTGERSAESTLSLLERQHGLKVRAEIAATVEGGARHG